jgi:hypothetical protein
MFLVATNKAKKLLYLSYIGHVRAEELRRGREEASALLADLPAGFRILADFGRLDVMDTNSAPEIGKLMEEGEKNGVGMIVRVIPNPSKDIGLNILTLLHYKKRVQVVTCQTMEEAQRALEI